MKVKYIKSIGGIQAGEVRDVGKMTAHELLKYEIAEAVEAKRGPGRPRKEKPAEEAKP